MAPLPCKLQHGNTLVVNDNLKISFQRTSEEPNYEMAIRYQTTAHIVYTYPFSITFCPIATCQSSRIVRPNAT
jgi:hypothetical protein